MGLYRDLLKRIDELSFGFPKSLVGADLMLIKKIFSKEDAQDFLLLQKGYQSPADFAEKNGLTEDVALEKLERMANKGLIFRRHTDHGDEYNPHPFVMGFLEWQAGRQNIGKSWLYYTCLYMGTSLFGQRMNQSMPFYRTIPHHKEFVEGAKILPYDDVDALLDRHTRFAVGLCMCRLMGNQIPGRNCDHPLETCIETDEYADFYIETGIGRKITKEEAREILRKGEDDGRIIQATNSQYGENLCSCCACGCGMLRLKQFFPGPARELWSNHYSAIDYDKCISCGKCVKRCPFNFIKKDKKTGKVTVDQHACLGCGLCVSTCPKDAIHLHQKEEDKLYTPPETYDDAIEIWEAETKKDYNKFK